MTTISKHETENGTLNKPPMFTPDDYDTWKVRMEGFIRNQDVKLWKSVLEGPFIPTIAAVLMLWVMLNANAKGYAKC
ncbi:hypothetical protein E3N88_03943 [Mikania micrantha]|uniref:DUF4219 domain-containing protein n=1 Tax=Mikania micrantha TaxID=192012 RepID=A0A5N6PSZ1_9ASTR|nr:hypothetical protein E3N88_03943 [Mikania micrantha]